MNEHVEGTSSAVSPVAEVPPLDASEEAITFEQAADVEAESVVSCGGGIESFEGGVDEEFPVEFQDQLDTPIGVSFDEQQRLQNLRWEGHAYHREDINDMHTAAQVAATIFVSGKSGHRNAGESTLKAADEFLYRYFTSFESTDDEDGDTEG